MNKHEQAKQLIEMICVEYGITMNDLKNRRSKYTKKSSQKKHISISSIRQGLSYFIFMHFPLKIKEISLMVGYSDHSPLSSQRKQIEFYIKTKDFYFYPYYQKIEEYAYLLGIDTKYKRFIAQSTPFVRYESDLEFLSNLKQYENAETIR